MFVNTVVNSVMLQLHLRHDFYNIGFKVKHTLYRASGSAHTQMKILGECLTNIYHKPYTPNDHSAHPSSHFLIDSGHGSGDHVTCYS